MNLSYPQSQKNDKKNPHSWNVGFGMQNVISEP